MPGLCACAARRCGRVTSSTAFAAAIAGRRLGLYNSHPSAQKTSAEDAAEVVALLVSPRACVQAHNALGVDLHVQARHMLLAACRSPLPLMS